MALQFRVRAFDGTQPYILEKAKSKSYFKAIGSADEGITFTIAKNDPKALTLNPDIDGYTRVWEVWDTRKNKRLNYGPITNITEQGSDWKIEGKGRSSFLTDFISSNKAFFADIGSLIDDLRFENIAAEPRTITLIHDTEDTPENTAVFGAVTVDEKYHGLSGRVKDNAIDDNTGVIRPGEIEPPNTYYTTDSYWAGMSKKDTLIIDLGQEFDLSKITALFPWWGGISKVQDRSYDFSIDYATSYETPITTLQGKNFGPFHQLYDSGDGNMISGKTVYTLMMGSDTAGQSFADPVFYTAQDAPTPIVARYLRVKIRDVNAWYGSSFDSDPAVNVWDYQCDPNYSGTRDKPPMKNKTISETTLGNPNDCFASVVEFGAFKTIIGVDTIKPLALQRIDNNNLQITYNHTPTPAETITTSQGFRKFEPGETFRKFTVQYSGATGSYTKFYPTDCSNCYPDPWAFGILDQNNSLIFSRDDDAGTFTRKVGAQTKLLLMRGADDAVITNCDSWPAVTDVLSWGGSYSYTKIRGDSAVIHFRGQSFKWYATIPATEIGARVSIQIRKKLSDNTWSAYDDLEADYLLPSDVYAQPVYAITYESGILEADTVYEIKIVNTNGGYCSIDSVEGYWSGSMVDYNEDSTRINFNHPDKFTQIYDKRFSSGSMFKWNSPLGAASFIFIGDRVILYSARGRNHGKISLALLNGDTRLYDPGTSSTVFIPGGDPVTGTLTVDLDTGRRGNEFAQAVIFDSNDYFPNGLPWDRYGLKIHYLTANVETYTTTDDQIDSNSFLRRCGNCKPPKGAVTVNKYLYIDGITSHEQVGLSISFDNKTHLDQLTAVTQAIQVEWDITDVGLRVEPRIGIDTDIILREGTNTLVDWEIVNDIENVATMLVSSGADIDGLPLFTITEDKKNRDIIGRTITRQQDFRDVADYFTLVGLSRTELIKRRYPEKRITVNHVSDVFELHGGDSFLLYTKKMGMIRVRINRESITEDASGGLVHTLECVKWDTSDIILAATDTPIFIPGPPINPGVPPSPEPPPEQIPVIPETPPTIPPPTIPPGSGGSGGSTSTGNGVMPTSDPSGWHRVFQDDFNTNVSEGGFLGAYSSRWSAYPTSYHDSSGHGQYDPGIISVSNSILNIRIHTDSGTHKVAAMTPQLQSGSAYQRYGRYEIRMRADSMHGYKAAYLLWPQSETWPRDGEIDFPEGDFDQKVSMFMHKQGATSGSDQAAFNSNTTYGGWHTYTLEWTSNRCEAFIDGVSIGSATSRIPNTPMRYVVQNETTLSGFTPTDSVSGNVQIDYVVVWEPA